MTAAVRDNPAQSLIGNRVQTDGCNRNVTTDRDQARRRIWLALHRATNPDPVAAVIDTADAARYAAGPYAPNLVADARARIVRSAPV